MSWLGDGEDRLGGAGVILFPQPPQRSSGGGLPPPPGTHLWPKDWRRAHHRCSCRRRLGVDDCCPDDASWAFFFFFYDGAAWRCRAGCGTRRLNEFAVAFLVFKVRKNPSGFACWCAARDGGTLHIRLQPSILHHIPTAPYLLSKMGASAAKRLHFILLCELPRKDEMRQLLHRRFTCACSMHAKLFVLCLCCSICAEALVVGTVDLVRESEPREPARVRLCCDGSLLLRPHPLICCRLCHQVEETLRSLPCRAKRTRRRRMRPARVSGAACCRCLSLGHPQQRALTQRTPQGHNWPRTRSLYQFSAKSA